MGGKRKCTVHAVNDVSHSEPPVTCPHPCCRRDQYHPCCRRDQYHPCCRRDQYHPCCGWGQYHPCCRRDQYHPCCGWGQRHHHLCRLLLCPLQNQSLYLLPPQPDHCLPPGRGGGGGKEERERRGRDILTLSHVLLPQE